MRDTSAHLDNFTELKILSSDNDLPPPVIQRKKKGNDSLNSLIISLI